MAGSIFSTDGNKNCHNLTYLLVRSNAFYRDNIGILGAVSDPCTHKVRAVDNSISESFASILFVTVTLVITFGPNCSSAAVNKYLPSTLMPVNAKHGNANDECRFST